MKYYLMEKYKLIDESGPYGMFSDTEIVYNIRQFKDINSLKKAWSEGPEHEGKLSIAKGLDIKILFEEKRGK